MKLTIKAPNPITLLVVLHLVILLLATVLLFRQKAEPPKARDRIVVVPIEGVIAMEPGSLSRGESVPELVETINQLAERESVRAVVLRINSPGGSVGAVQELYGALKRLKEKEKIIVSSFGEVSASGGYYIASLSDKIVAQPGSLTGSIGVIMQFPNVQGLLNKVGISFETVKSGHMKDAGSPFRSMTEQERAYFKDVMMDAYDQFFHAVKEGRKMDDKTLRPLADGRIFSGRMALKAKLVDDLGGVKEATDLAKVLAGLETKNPEIVVHKEKPSLERLLQLFSRSPVQELAQSTVTEFKLLYRMP